MSYLPVVNQMVGTVTCGVSGIGSIIPARSNTPFKDLSISVKPIEDNTRYTATVFLFGEVEETHTYNVATDRVIAHFMFPNTYFPANIGTDVIPIFFNPDRRDFGGLPVLVQIQSREADRRTFEVYAMFENYSNCNFGVLTQEE